MSLREAIKKQEAKKKGVSSIGKNWGEPKPKRLTDKKQIDLAITEQEKLIIQALRDGKRKQPDDVNWLRGYHAAMSIVQKEFESQ